MFAFKCTNISDKHSDIYLYKYTTFFQYRKSQKIQKDRKVIFHLDKGPTLMSENNREERKSLFRIKYN